MTLTAHLLYASAWLSFGLGHSLLAGRRGRALMAPLVGRRHRLAYNVVAVLHLATILALGRMVLAPDPVPFDRPVWLMALQAAAVLAAVLLFVAGGRRYDLARLSGMRVENAGAPVEPLVTDGIHAHLRHPLYAAGYLLLFGLVSDELALATAVWAALYLAVGTAIEERRLEGIYGDAYRAYRRRVPALIPRLSRSPPWDGR